MTARRLGLLATAAAALLVATAHGASLRAERSSRLSGGDTASEYWDFSSRFDSGHSLFTRFLITNEGPGERTAVATWYLVDPDGSLVLFRNGRRQARWTLSRDGSRIEIGSSVFDQSGPVHLLEYDSGKRKIRVDLRFTPDATVPLTGAAVAGDYAMDLLDVGAKVTGTIWHGKMAAPAEVSGTLTLTHTWMDRSEPDLALRRVDFSTEGSGPAIYLSDLTTPGGDRHRWLVVERDGEVMLRTREFELELSGRRRSSVDGYPIPGKLRLSGPQVNGTIDPGPVLVEANPLDVIPQPFRFLLSLKMRPHRVWARASYEIQLNPLNRTGDQELPPVELKGSGVAAITFLNPLPPHHS